MPFVFLNKTNVSLLEVTFKYSSNFCFSKKHTKAYYKNLFTKLSNYRPLIDFCKRNKLSVIAANCSEQHTRVMSEEGPKGLEKLADDSELHRQEQINLYNR